MSVFLKQFKTKQIFHAYKVLIAAQARQSSHFYPYYKPGSYPKTKEEREAAAKKYNLLPEEYEPYPENEIPVGDYPKLSFESVDSKDPYHSWDIPELRKDYNDPVPREIMILLPEALSTTPKEFSIATRILVYFSLVSATILFILMLYQWELVHPVTEKQYPTPGVTHYTFNRISDEELEKVRAEERLKECLENYKLSESQV